MTYEAKMVFAKSYFSFQHFFSSFLSRETVYKLLVQVWGEIKEKQLVRMGCGFLPEIIVAQPCALLMIDSK